MRKGSGTAVLMTVTLYLAMGLGALLNPRDSTIWVSTIYSVTACLMATATLLAVAGPAPAKLAWTGFAIFGWAYFLLCFRELVFGTTPHLITTWVIGELNETGVGYVKHFSNELSFVAIMHSVFTVLSGFVGSRLARSVCGGRSNGASASG
jgi:hypothetical protein